MESAIFMVILILILGVLGGAGIYAKKMIDKTDPGVQNAVSDKDAQNAQQFLPFVDIRDFVIDLGEDKYRAVLECSSVNYNLKTELERDVIEVSYQNFISSLSHPITIHIQTKKIDNTLIVRELERDVEVLKRKNPGLQGYGEQYLESIKGLGTYLGDSRQKKKYIIIPYDEAANMGDLTHEEKFEFAKHQLNDRVWYIKDQLSTMGIKSELLSEHGLVDLVYNAYHRDQSVFDVSEGISKGEFFSAVVLGNDKKASMSVEQKMDFEMLQLQNRIKEEFLGVGVSKEVEQRAAHIYEALNELRDSVGKPYKSSYNSIYIPNDKPKEVQNNNKVEDVRVKVKEVCDDEKVSTSCDEAKIEVMSKSGDMGIDLFDDVDMNKSDDKEIELFDDVDMNKSDDKEIDLFDDIDMSKSDDKEIDLFDDVDMNKSDDKEIDLFDDIDMNKSDDKEIDLFEDVDMNKSDDKEIDLFDDIDMSKSDDKEIDLFEDVDMSKSDDKEIDLFDDIDMSKSDDKEIDLFDDIDMSKSDDKEINLFENVYSDIEGDSSKEEYKKSSRMNDLLMFE